MEGLNCFGWTSGGNGGGGGGNITGGGTINYVAMFTPSGTAIGDAPIKISDNIRNHFLYIQVRMVFLLDIITFQVEIMFSILELI